MQSIKKATKRYETTKMTIFLLFILTICLNHSVFAASASEINAKVNVALNNLYKNSPGASTLAKEPKAILAFPI